MAYVGTPIDTRNQFQSLQGKRFNGDGSTTAFTLDVAPSSTLDIEVFVGNVRQDPNSAYTLSGTTLTFTGAPPSGTNNIYVVHQAKSVGTIDPPATETVAKTFSGAVNVTGAFNSVGIDDNGDATTLTIDTSENVNIGDATNRGFGPLQLGNTSDSHAYIQMLSSTSGQIHFGDATSGDAREIGAIQYRHDENAMKLKTSGNVGLQIDSAGHVTKPLQPAFMANKSASGQTPSASTATTVVFENEVFDNNADYNTSNSTFTAPVTGRYWFHTRIRTDNVGGGTGIYSIRLVASNRTIHNTQVDLSDFLDGTMDRMSFSVTGLLDMDASDTCKVQVYEDSGYEIEDEVEETFFMGYLVC